jgi:hypothetical protein
MPPCSLHSSVSVGNLAARRMPLPWSSQSAIYAVERLFDLGSIALVFCVTLMASPSLNALPHHELFHRIGYAANGRYCCDQSIRFCPAKLGRSRLETRTGRRYASGWRASQRTPRLPRKIQGLCCRCSSCFSPLFQSPANPDETRRGTALLAGFSFKSAQAPRKPVHKPEKLTPPLLT